MINIKIGNGGQGLSFLPLLAVAFIVLKLIEKIDWSWWWVLSPILIPGSLVVIGFATYGLICLAIYFWGK